MTVKLPAHGPGCLPLTGLRSARFPHEPRYICAANCPRRQALAPEVGAIPSGPHLEVADERIDADDME
jgi:hypothetical protein